MTKQIQDTVRFHDKDYAMLWSIGSGLFDPAGAGINPASMSTACYRGYICTYDIIDSELFLTRLYVRGKQPAYPRIGGVEPTLKLGHAEYHDIRLAMPFDGRLFLGLEAFSQQRATLPHEWKEIRECRFVRGRFDHDVDHSAVFRTMREEVRRQVKESCRTPPREAAHPSLFRSQEEICAILLSRLTPNQWWRQDLSWAYEVVRTLKSSPSLLGRELQALEDTDCRLRERQGEIDKKALEEERLAQRWFARIESEDWNCTHCGRHGAAHDFRLSTGVVSCIICKRCGWTQTFPEES